MRKPSNGDVRRKHRATDFVNRNLEMELVAGILRGSGVLEEINSKFSSEWITSDRIKKIYEMCVDLYSNTGNIMDTKSFRNLLNVEEAKQKLYISLWKKLLKMSKTVTSASTITASAKLSKLYTARNLQLCVKESIQHLEKALSGDLESIDKAGIAVDSLHESIHAQSINKVHVSNPVDQYSDYKKNYKKIQADPSLAIGVPTGIPAIDQDMVGLRKGELGVVVGPTGSGKSIAIMEFALNAWRLTGEDVVVVTIEMSEQQYLSRLYSHMAGIKYNKFRKYELTKLDWKAIDQQVERMNNSDNKIHIVDMPEGCSVINARNEVKKIMRKRKVGMVIVDYMNIMCGPTGKVSFEWQNQLEIAVQMKLEFARALKVPVWTACQTDGADDFGFSKHIKDQLDVAGLLSLTEDTEKSGIIFWEWLKTRDFEGKPLALHTNHSYMRITPLPVKIQDREEKMKSVRSKPNVTM